MKNVQFSTLSAFYLGLKGLSCTNQTVSMEQHDNFCTRICRKITTTS